MWACVCAVGTTVLLWEGFSDGYYRRLRPEEQYVVSFDATTVTLSSRQGAIDSVLWSDLSKVVIETTSAGPLVCDYFIHLVGEETLW